MHDVSAVSPPTIADDLLYGVPAIAKETDLTERQVRYLIEKGRLPTKRLGKIYIASRKKLRRALSLPD